MRDARHLHRSFTGLLGRDGEQIRSADFTVLRDTLADGGVLVVECALTIYNPNEGSIRKVEVGEATAEDGEAFKAGYSDSLKRAARRFGVGRYLAFV